MKNPTLKILSLILFTSLIIPAISQAEPQTITTYQNFIDSPEKPAARLRVLNKQNGTIRRFDLPKGRMAVYESLEIELYHCRGKAGRIKPQAAAMIKISEVKDDSESYTNKISLKKNKEPEKTLYFSGWMISHHPELAPLEHPVYDVILEDCVDL